VEEISIGSVEERARERWKAGLNWESVAGCKGRFSGRDSGWGEQASGPSPGAKKFTLALMLKPGDITSSVIIFSARGGGGGGGGQDYKPSE
jgi:hypothetical protein